MQGCKFLVTFAPNFAGMKPTILTIETSTSVCSAALCRGDEVLDYRVSQGEANHARLLAVYIDELLRSKGMGKGDVDAVAVSSGPGSYTGLRIGVSTAKGLAYGWGVPLVNVPTLEVLSAVCLQRMRIPEDALLCPMLDARRMEVYTALYDSRLQLIGDIESRVVDNAYWLPDKDVYYFGNGAEKLREVMQRVRAGQGSVNYVENIEADARVMGGLAALRLANGQTEDVAYFEPFYLKEFVAAPSHIKGLQ